MAAPRRHEDPVVQYAFRQYVAGNWKRAHAPQRLLRIAGRFLAWRRG